MNIPFITVHELNQYIKSKFSNDEVLQTVQIKGEVSNCKIHRSGHIYFTLKDENSRISCVMFNRAAAKLDFSIEEGNSVLITGRVEVYEVNGQYQVYVDKMTLDGLGNLFLQYEKTKQKLLEEGYFDIEHKKNIPNFPSAIAVLSAYPSAAVMDILKTIKLRFPAVRVIVYPIPVQGQNAYMNIIETLSHVDSLGFSAIILARGGGSIEDLWNFNEIDLVKSIYHCNTPIITGVGHETDTTLCDYVSDLRVATPTAAAVASTPDCAELLTTINEMQSRLITTYKYKIETAKLHLSTYTNNRVLKDFQYCIDDKKITLDQYNEQLQYKINNKLSNNKQKFCLLSNNLNNSIEVSMVKIKHKLQLNEKLLVQHYTNSYKSKGIIYYNLITKLDALSPLKVLSRGYSLVSKDKHYITDSSELKNNDSIKIEFKKGSIDAIVIKGE